MKTQNIQLDGVKTRFFTEVDTPEKIIKFLERKNGIKKIFNSKKYSVTELLKCPRETFYKKQKVPKEETLDSSVGGMWCSVRGQFMHQMTQAYTWNELECEHSVTLSDGGVSTIVGRLDMYDEKTKTVLDLKTTNDVMWKAKKEILIKSEHIKQLQIYYTMFSKIIPIENLYLVYADMTDIVTYTIPVKDRSKWIVSRIEEIQSSIQNGLVPDGEVNEKCRFCKYQTKCSKTGSGLTRKPLSVPRKLDF